MKYCIILPNKPNRTIELLSAANEIIIPWFARRIGHLTLQDFPDTIRTLLMPPIVNSTDIDIITDNYSADTSRLLFTDIEQAQKIRIKYPEIQSFPFYCATTVNSVSLALQMVKLGVCSIFIANELLKDITTLKQLQSLNVEKRALPVTARDITDGFIRPEGIDLYENLIDILDFSLEPSRRANKLINIYKSKEYTSLLCFLISTLPEIQNSFLPKDFDERHSNCFGLDCSSCNYCARAVNTAQSINEIITSNHA